MNLTLIYIFNFPLLKLLTNGKEWNIIPQVKWT